MSLWQLVVQAIAVPRPRLAPSCSGIRGPSLGDSPPERALRELAKKFPPYSVLPNRPLRIAPRIYTTAARRRTHRGAPLNIDHCPKPRRKVGGLLMWNNLSLLHRRDPFDPKSRRIMHRSQIKGNGAVHLSCSVQTSNEDREASICAVSVRVAPIRLTSRKVDSAVQDPSATPVSRSQGWNRNGPEGRFDAAGTAGLLGRIVSTPVLDVAREADPSCNNFEVPMGSNRVSYC